MISFSFIRFSRFEPQQVFSRLLVCCWATLLVGGLFAGSFGASLSMIISTSIGLVSFLRFQSHSRLSHSKRRGEFCRTFVIWLFPCNHRVDTFKIQVAWLWIVMLIPLRCCFIIFWCTLSKWRHLYSQWCPNSMVSFFCLCLDTASQFRRFGVRWLCRPSDFAFIRVNIFASVFLLCSTSY